MKRAWVCLLVISCGGEVEASNRGGNLSEDGGVDDRAVGPDDSAIEAPAVAGLGLVTLASSVDCPGPLVVGGSNVYWAKRGGAVETCSVFGCGNRPTVVANGVQKFAEMSPVQNMAADATNVYWTNAFTAEVFECAADGCGGVPVKLDYPQVDGGSTPWLIDPRGGGIAVRGSGLYWGGYDQNGAGGGMLMECAVAGCSANPRILTSGQSWVSTLAVDATSIYWLDAAGSTILQCPLSGCLGPPASFVAAQGSVADIATDGTNVYWTVANAVMSCPASNCSHPNVVYQGPGGPLDLATDGSNVYWTDGDTHALLKCPVAGCAGAPTILASGQDSFAVAVDATSVYWANATDGVVRPILEDGSLPLCNGSIMKLTPK